MINKRQKVQRGGDPTMQPEPTGKKRKVYTTGTLYEKETGRYQSSPWDDTSISRGHGKKVGTGTVTVKKGKRLKGSTNWSAGVSGDPISRRDAAAQAAIARYEKKKKAKK